MVDRKRALGRKEEELFSRKEQGTFYKEGIQSVKHKGLSEAV
jgi:hypothetical protein